MNYYRCKCGSLESWSSTGPTPCTSCEKCDSNLASGPHLHEDPKPHTFEQQMVETDEGPKPLSRCRYCGDTKQSIEQRNLPPQVVQAEEQRWAERHQQREQITQAMYKALHITELRAVWPHCDDLVLHIPGACTICDQYAADLQQARIQANMNFTGESDPNKLPDPATQDRPLDILANWPGNTPILSTGFVHKA